jgi:hypothetical protein
MNKMNLSDKVFYLRMESKSEDDIRNYITSNPQLRA